MPRFCINVESWLVQWDAFVSNFTKIIQTFWIDGGGSVLRCFFCFFFAAFIYVMLYVFQ